MSRKRGRPPKTLPHFLGTLSLIGWRPKTKADYALVPPSFLKKRGPKPGSQRCDDEAQLARMLWIMLADRDMTRFGAAYTVTGARRRSERGDHPATVRRLAAKFKARVGGDVERMRRIAPRGAISTEN